MRKRGRPVIYKTLDDKNIRKLQLSKSELKNISFDTFKKWYLFQNNCCIYCGLTNLESIKLSEKFPKSTRGGKRGFSLELDRKDSNIIDYSILENLCLACYWCNNAKTNYFSFEEFKIIGNAIQQIQIHKLLKP
jgi:hypothetical protein